MAKRVTIVTLRIPWDDEDHGHPAGWGYDVLLGLDKIPGDEVNVINFADIEEEDGDSAA